MFCALGFAFCDYIISLHSFVKIHDHLIEAYGLDCYHETADGLYFEIGFDNRAYMVGWLLGFGDKVKVLEPTDMATEIQVIAKNILSRYL